MKVLYNKYLTTVYCHMKYSAFSPMKDKMHSLHRHDEHVHCRTLMRQIAPSEFLMGDIVLVEATRVLRTECAGNVCCTFDLLSMSRLFAADHRSTGVVHGDFEGAI